MKQEVYLIPSYRCNLNCPHCQIATTSNEDFSAFLKAYETINSDIKNQNDISYILFGGEPLLNGYDKIKQLIDFGKKLNKPICTTTSNLLLLDDKILDLLLENNIIIGTSWNPHRFTAEQEELWFKNIQKIADRKTNVALFVTLTYDLFRSNFPNILDKLEKIGNVASVTLNPYIPGSDKLREETDKYLCYLDDIWRWKIRFLLRENYQNILSQDLINICHSCLGVKTIEPNGNIKSGCAHEGNEHGIFEKCFDCKYKSLCLHAKCPKQPVCNFFDKFYEQIIAKYKLNHVNGTSVTKLTEMQIFSSL